jgi:hypothetical protein
MSSCALVAAQTVLNTNNSISHYMNGRFHEGMAMGSPLTRTGSANALRRKSSGILESSVQSAALTANIRNIFCLYASKTNAGTMLDGARY